MHHTFLILGFAILSAALAQLLLKRGVLKLGVLDFSIQGFLGLIPRILQNVWLLGGLFLLGVAFLLWLFVISRIKINVAYPVVASLTISLIALFSWLFFKEHLGPIQILGIAVIIFGIFLVLKP